MKPTNELLLKCIKELRKQQRQYQVYENYYLGKHDILYNYAFNEERSNQKVIVNFFRKFIKDEIAYSLGNSINYISRDKDSDIAQQIDIDFGHWQKVHDQELATQSAIFGKAYELDYINEYNQFKSTVLTPLNCYVLESGDAEKNVVLALHNYKQHKFSQDEMIDVYYDNKIDTYKLNEEDEPTFVKDRAHIFGSVPIRVNSYNMEKQSLLDDIKHLNDSYNNVLSDLVNEVSDFRQAMMKITGAKLEEDDAKKMKKSGIIQVPDNAKIDYLIKNINDTFVQNTLETLEEKMYKLSSHVDTNAELSSNVSGVALRSRMISLENKCSLIQSLLETTVKKRLQNYFRFLGISEGKKADHRTIKVKFTMNIPHDTNLIADSISKLGGVVSQQTLISMIPSIENPEHELERFYEEQERNREMEMRGIIDLENLGLDNSQVELDEDE